MLLADPVVPWDDVVELLAGIDLVVVYVPAQNPTAATTWSAGGVSTVLFLDTANTGYMGSVVAPVNSNL